MEGFIDLYKLDELFTPHVYYNVPFVVIFEFLFLDVEPVRLRNREILR